MKPSPARPGKPPLVDRCRFPASRAAALFFLLGHFAGNCVAEAQTPGSSAVTTLGWTAKGTRINPASIGLRNPCGIAVDRDGVLYLADTDSHTIRKIGPTGLTTTYAGEMDHPGRTDGISSAALFSYPTGVAVDGAGNLYVADAGNHVIRKIDSSGIVSTFAGQAQTRARPTAPGVWRVFRIRKE